MTNKEMKQQVKEALKAEGFDTSLKAMSIKVKTSGYSDMYINVVLKSFINKRKDVEDILWKFRDVHYDNNGCGDILQGCNTFVKVKYDYEFLQNAIKQYYDEANEIIKNTKSNGNCGELVKQDGDRKAFYYKDLGICSIDGKQRNAENTHELANCLLNFALSGSVEKEV